MTGSLGTGRVWQTATLLPNGKVLVTGGGVGANCGGGPYLTSAELYDPASGVWTATGDLLTARAHHTATLLANGKVLVVGGLNSSNYLASAELYDPASGTWAATGSLGDVRVYHTATLLPNGKVLVAGGQGPGNGMPDLSSTEVYDPVSGTWARTGGIGIGRVLHSSDAAV